MTPPAIDFRNVNSLWCGVAVETMARMGVRHAVVCPGSRSTPLTMALAGHPRIEAIPVLDERSASFFALGLARQRGEVVALVCTSGTAAANFFPAVIEARESGTPLLIVTADRPPEMRACSSGQTIDQLKLYGGYPVFQHELAVPEASEGMLRYLRQTVAHACSRAVGPESGPVHLNAPFRDPLPPLTDGTAEKWSQALDWDAFFAHLEPPPAVEWVGPVPDFGWEVHGAIVAGPAEPADPQEYAIRVGEISRKLGWPVLADGLSPLRHRSAAVPHLVTAYDAILRNSSTAARLRPEKVLCIGGWPTSKILRTWLESSGAAIWMAGEGSANRDSLHGHTQAVQASLSAIASALPEVAGTSGYGQMWAGYETAAREALDAGLAAERELFEPKAAWLLARHLPENTAIFVANSMPARDAEYVWPAGNRRLRPLFNRGANGIDGTLSSALGTAHGGKPAVLLTGDLALLHDANGFLIRPKFRGSLTIVLINNRGGGIFEHLPVSQFDPPFEEFFATPQEADFAKLCAAHGVGHVQIANWEQFTAFISSLPESGIRVLEIRTDRKRDAARRRELFAAAARL